ncbi:MAG: hypothetical protein K0U74_02820 [Alphaproteobacteria bacterium]|nr:hypothetical protein [Alphaproteobacteria bacterium]
MTDDNYFLHKHLTELSQDDLAKVKELSQIDLKGASEATVRELFLAPLVRLLGYSRAGEFQVT